jgi:hypothetical protein
MPSSDVLDLLGKRSICFKQADESILLPMKLNGHYHFLVYVSNRLLKSSLLLMKFNGHYHIPGDLEVMGFVHIESALFSVSHLYKHNIKFSDKFLTLPILRNVFGRCCHDLGHGANPISGCRVTGIKCCLNIAGSDRT